MTRPKHHLPPGGALQESTLRIFAKRCGFDEATARKWWNAGLGPYDAERALQAGHTLKQAAAELAAVRKSRTEAELAAQAFRERCARVGVKPDALLATGIEPEQLTPWIGLGLRVGDVVALVQAGATARQRDIWRNAGFPLKEVVKFIKRGTPPGRVASVHSEALLWASVPSARRVPWRALDLPVERVLELESDGLWPVDFVRGRTTPGRKPTVWHDDDNSPKAWSDTAERLFDKVETKFGVDLRGSSVSFLEGFGFAVTRTTQADRWLARDCPGKHVVVATDAACFRVVGVRGGSVRIEEPAGYAPNETVAVVERLDSWDQAFAQFADRVPEGEDAHLRSNLAYPDLCRSLDVWASQLEPHIWIDVNGNGTYVATCADGFGRWFPEDAFEDWNPPPGITTVYASLKSGYDARVILFGDLLAWSEDIADGSRECGVIGRISPTVDPLLAAQPYTKWFGIRDSGRPVEWVLTGDEYPDFVRRWSRSAADTEFFWEMRPPADDYYWSAVFTVREGERVVYEDESFGSSMAWSELLTCRPGDRYETSDEGWLLEYLCLSGKREDYPDTIEIELNGRPVELEVADLVPGYDSYW